MSAQGERPSSRRKNPRTLTMMAVGAVALGGAALLHHHASQKPTVQQTQRSDESGASTSPCSTLGVRVLDCDIMMEDGACYPLPSLESHRVAVTGIPMGAIELRLDGKLIASDQELKIDIHNHCERFFRVPLIQENKTHSIAFRLGKERWEVTFRTFVPQLPPWLKELWDARHAATPKIGPAEEQQILERHLADPDVQAIGIVRSLTLSLIARGLDADTAALRTRPEPSAITRAYERAIEAAEAARVITERNENVLWFSEYLSKRLGKIQEAEEVLSKYQTVLLSDHRRKAYFHRQRALHHWLRRKWSEALADFDSALVSAQQIDDQTAVLDVVMLGADLWLAQGRVATAAAWANKKWQSKTPDTGKLLTDGILGCRNQEQRLTNLHIIRVAQESQLGQALPIELRKPDALWRSFSEEKGHCDRADWRAAFLIEWGRLHVSSGATDEVEKALAMLEESAPVLKTGADVTPDFEYLYGMQALAKGSLDDAKKHFQLLRSMSPSIGDERAWEAEVGLAHVAKKENDDAAALEHHKNADTIVDTNARADLWNPSKASFLGRFERGTREYLQLLWTQGKKEEALALIRKARLRGLIAIPSLLTADISPEKRAELTERLQSARAELEQTSAEHAPAAGNQLPLIETKISAAYRKFAKQTEALLKEYAAAGSADRNPSGMPRQGEVLIACHPLPTSWLCLAQDGKGVVGSVLSTKDVDALAALSSDDSEELTRLSKLFLDPFAEKIGSARRVSFLPYGRLRNVDFQLLRFGPHGLPLMASKQVVFALDHPSHRTRAPAAIEDFRPKMNQTAYLFGNEISPKTGSSNPSVACPVANALSEIAPLANGLGITTLSTLVGVEPACNLGPLSVLSKKSEFLEPKQFADGLARADSLVVITHAKDSSATSPERSLDLGRDRRFFVSDILTRPLVPQWAALIACGSAKSDAEWSNLESMGLTQAFIWRGTRWVIGTERTVHVELATRVSIAFFKELARSKDPFQALRYATTHDAIPLRDAKHDPQRDLGAFRLYAP